jgi:hypothetical protein
MNDNGVCTERISNPVSELLCKSMQAYRGPPCVGCTLCAAILTDPGLCHGRVAHHHLEVGIEHCTCPVLGKEGLGARLSRRPVLHT